MLTFPVGFQSHPNERAEVSLVSDCRKLQTIKGPNRSGGCLLRNLREIRQVKDCMKPEGLFHELQELERRWEVRRVPINQPDTRVLIEVPCSRRWERTSGPQMPQTNSSRILAHVSRSLVTFTLPAV